jgi:hypothetical protein
MNSHRSGARSALGGFFAGPGLGDLVDVVAGVDVVGDVLAVGGFDDAHVYGGDAGQGVADHAGVGVAGLVAVGGDGDDRLARKSLYSGRHFPAPPGLQVATTPRADEGVDVFLALGDPHFTAIGDGGR